MAAKFQEPRRIELARWLEKLQACDLDLKHREKRSHVNADGLSRRPCCEEDRKFCESQETKNQAGSINQIRNVTNKEVTVTTEVENSVSREQIIEAQRLDPDLSIIREWLEKDLKPEWQDVSRPGPTVQGFWLQWDSLQLRDDLITR